MEIMVRLLERAPGATWEMSAMESQMIRPEDRDAQVLDEIEREEAVNGTVELRGRALKDACPE